MTRYRVFLDAPKFGAEGVYRWDTASISLAASFESSHAASQPKLNVPVLSTAHYKAASQRISRIYSQVVFQEETEEDMYANEVQPADDDQNGSWRDPESLRRENSRNQFRFDETAPSFLNQTTVHTQRRISIAGADTQMSEETASYDYSGGGGESIANLPAFTFSLRALTSLAALTKPVVAGRYDEPGGSKNRKVNVVLAVLEIEGPETIHIKKGPNVGSVTLLLKMVLGDEDGDVCKLTAWREIAEQWADAKKGDVVYIQNVQAAIEGQTAPSLTASPWQKPSMTICYRTLPYSHEDTRYRPDLRLAATDAAMRKVASVVRWITNYIEQPKT